MLLKSSLLTEGLFYAAHRKKHSYFKKVYFNRRTRRYHSAPFVSFRRIAKFRRIGKKSIIGSMSSMLYKS